MQLKIVQTTLCTVYLWVTFLLYVQVVKLGHETKFISKKNKIKDRGLAEMRYVLDIWTNKQNKENTGCDN